MNSQLERVFFLRPRKNLPHKQLEDVSEVFKFSRRRVSNDSNAIYPPKTIYPKKVLGKFSFLGGVLFLSAHT
jgi:hypothetical protein